MVDCWVKVEALVESKYAALSIKSFTELRGVHCVILEGELIGANRFLFHLAVLNT